MTRGEDTMGDEIRYHFYVTNVPAAEMSGPEVTSSRATPAATRRT